MSLETEENVEKSLDSNQSNENENQMKMEMEIEKTDGQENVDNQDEEIVVENVRHNEEEEEEEERPFSSTSTTNDNNENNLPNENSFTFQDDNESSIGISEDSSKPSSGQLVENEEMLDGFNDDCRDKNDEDDERIKTPDSASWNAGHRDSFAIRQHDYRRQQNDIKSLSAVIDDIRMKWRKLRQEHEDQTLLIDDGSQKLIKNRLDEVKSMCRHTVRSEYLLASLPKHLQDYVWSLTKSPAIEFVRKRRLNWTLIDHFIYAGRMARKLAALCMSHRKLMDQEYHVNTTIEEQTARTRESILLDKQIETQKYSLAKPLRMSLWTLPPYRTTQDIKQILWFLHTYDIFIHWFPSEMEKKCARYVGYERYDDGRIIAYQGRSPMKCYYVISGKIDQMKHYKLMMGEVNRSVGNICAGMTTDPTLLQNEKPLDYFMVSRGLVEVLTLERSDYLELLKSFASPPIDFIKNISIFQEFPCELFLSHPEEIQVKYYPKEKIIVGDSNRTPYLHIVKSGCVKVCRQQFVYNKHLKPVFHSRDPIRLGTLRPYGYSKAMLGLPGRQKEWKEKTQTLPPIISQFQAQRSKTMMPLSRSSRSNSSNASFKERRISATSTSSSTDSQILQITIQTSEEFDDLPIISPQLNETNSMPKIYEEEAEFDTNSDKDYFNSQHLLLHRDSDNSLEKHSSRSKTKQSSGAGRNHTPLMFIDQRRMSEMERTGSHKNVQQLSRVFLSREKSDLSTVLTGRKSIIIPERPTFVQLDSMRKLDVFGFKNLSEFKEDLSMKESWSPEQYSHLAPDSIVLISDGAEVIRIRKKFFLDNAENNTMLKVETMNKEYASEAEAKKSLEEQETWHLYRKALIRGMSEIICSKTTRHHGICNDLNNVVK